MKAIGCSSRRTRDFGTRQSTTGSINGAARNDRSDLAMRVIPRLAQRAEGPLERSIATAQHSTQSALHAETFAEAVPTTARSLGALRQPRDDSATLNVS